MITAGCGGAVAQNLTIAIGGAPASPDPHVYNSAPNASLTQHLFDTLVERDAPVRLRPMLAESWRLVEPTIWEFKLRPNVPFQKGNAFTAEDVAFTIGRVPAVRNAPAPSPAWPAPSPVSR
ncbi:ABC transporter substrate-binding protein [Neoroseomonas alba]|uniref:ABC transporter substrate-binding protein n=1 Tax=Roseomonas alba TaxID=2846776 RepID=UPI0021085521|nr:ABC transporter substrate-binding protein [Neoroseomonas alba]